MTKERREQIRALLRRLNPGYGFTQGESRALFSAALELEQALDEAHAFVAGLADSTRKQIEEAAS